MVAAGCHGSDAPDARIANKIDAGGGGGADAAVADAPPGTPDAHPRPDAQPAATYTGTVSLVDLTVKSPAQAAGAEGGAFQADFEAIDLPNDATNIVSTGAIGGCTAFLYDKSAATPDTFPVAEAEGDMTATINDVVSADAGVPVGGLACPGAAFVPGVGYTCPVGTGSAGTSAPLDCAVLATPTCPGFSSFTDATATYSAASVGHQLFISGNLFPIVGFHDSHEVAIFTGALATPLTAVSSIELAAAGPVPASLSFTSATDGTVGAASDYFAGTTGPFANFDLTKGGGNDFESHPSLLVPVGDTFALDTTSTNYLKAKLPTTTANQVITCGSNCGRAEGTVITFKTTDTAVTGLTDMPAPTTKFVTGNCNAVGAGSVTLPKAVIDLIAKTGTSTTRLEWIVLRVGFDPGETNKNGPKNSVQYVSGHGQVFFVDAPNGP
jgi:hypothetical protein